MEKNMSNDANPFQKIEKVIVVVLVIWVFALVGWFINNQQVPKEQKLVKGTELFLEKNDLKAVSVKCVFDDQNEFGTCSVVTSAGKNLVVKCPVTSMFSDFASVFFAKGQPCEFVE